MLNLLSKIYKKHSIWIEIVHSFGVNKDTSEDIVMEMYIKIKKNIDRGVDIRYGEEDYNYYYIFKTLKSLFLDLKRKEAKVKIISLDSDENIIDYQKYFSTTDETNFNKTYLLVEEELNKMHWYDKKVYLLIDNGTSVANLSRRTTIPYHSLYNTYKKVINRLKKIL
tara:strand:- start:120 stop:620 length:501 start_codon:yes stop_codon:yes gene_type:complete